MVGHTWIHSLLIVTGLQFTGAALIRSGDDVSLPCNYLIPDQSRCDATTWLYSVSGSAVALFEHGKIREAASKSNRLSLTENCSLVIKNVTDQDFGRYTCRQFGKSGPQIGEDAPVELHVVTLTQREHDDTVTLNCRALTRRWRTCRAKWLFEDKDLEKPSVKSSESLCDAAVTFSRSSFYSRFITSFTCEVRDDDNHQNFTFNLQPPDATTATTESSVPTRTAADETTITNSDGLQGSLWLFIAAALVLVALFLLVVIGWRRTRGNMRKNKDVGASSSAASPSALEPTANMADPEGSGPFTPVSCERTQTKCQADDEEPVSYASINFSKKNKAKAELCTKPDDNEGDSVTYSTVKASSADSSLYASIKKPRQHNVSSGCLSLSAHQTDAVTLNSRAASNH